MTLGEFAGAVGGTELFVLVTVSGILAATWVYADARRRGAVNPALWAAAVGFLFLFYALPGLVALIIYLVMRGSISGGGGDGVERYLPSDDHE